MKLLAWREGEPGRVMLPGVALALLALLVAVHDALPI